MLPLKRWWIDGEHVVRGSVDTIMVELGML